MVSYVNLEPLRKVVKHLLKNGALLFVFLGGGFQLFKQVIDFRLALVNGPGQLSDLLPILALGGNLHGLVEMVQVFFLSFDIGFQFFQALLQGIDGP